MPIGSGDSWPQDYERGRPGWPPAVAGLSDLSSDSIVVDLGAGTGKLTRVLVPAFQRVVAVEPAEQMRRVLAQVCPNVDLLCGTGQDIPLGTASVDGVFAAQAFHWFEKDVALPEIARVLRPGGVFAVIWNGPDEEQASPLPDAFRAELDALHDAVSHPWREEPEWEDLLRATGAFADVHERTSVVHDHVLDRAELLDNARSVSWIASREDRDEVVARLGELLPDGTYAIPNRANILWARKP
jgi:SAM-dependent methyltransferase